MEACLSGRAFYAINESPLEGMGFLCYKCKPAPSGEIVMQNDNVERRDCLVLREEILNLGILFLKWLLIKPNFKTKSPIEYNKLHRIGVCACTVIYMPQILGHIIIGKWNYLRYWIIYAT